ncbi:hypothetical protein BV20DRAFT_980895 [Pilatotrama ljubarskyi]|nr:hypothetical protein BV20DRAFT_980895 [Pilatotrama ljubarskyi]
MSNRIDLPSSGIQFYDDDEEDEEVEELTQVAARPRAEDRSDAAPGGVPGGNDHQNALYSLQLTSQQQQDKIRELQMKLAAAEAKAAKRPKKGKAKTTDTPPSEEPITASSASTAAQDEPEIFRLKDVIATAGRKYSFVTRPWPPPPAAWQYTERPPVDPLDATTRYPKDGTTEQKSNALLRAYGAEIYNLLPLSLHPHVNNDFVINEFTQKIYDQKSKIVSKARAARHHIFKDTERLKLAVLASASALESDPVVLEYRSMPSNPYPPILFPDGKAGKTKYLFMSTSIAWFIRVTLFGPSSMDYTNDDAPTAKQYQPRYNAAAKSWGIKQLTPGMIAFAAVGVRHLLYPEEDFDSNGSTSHVPYETFFNEYVKILISYWTSPRIVKVREWLTALVFKNIVASAASAGALQGTLGEGVDALDLDELNESASSDDQQSSASPVEDAGAPDHPAADIRGLPILSSSGVSYASRPPSVSSPGLSYESSPSAQPRSLSQPLAAAAPRSAAADTRVAQLPTTSTASAAGRARPSVLAAAESISGGPPGGTAQAPGFRRPTDSEPTQDARAVAGFAHPQYASNPNELAAIFDEVSLSGGPVGEQHHVHEEAAAPIPARPAAAASAVPILAPPAATRKGPAVKPRKARPATTEAQDVATGGSHTVPPSGDPTDSRPAAQPPRRSTRKK